MEKLPHIKTEQSEALPDGAREKIAAWSRQWLQDIYDNPDSAQAGDQFEGAKKLETSIAELTEQLDALRDGRITPEYGVGARYFFETLIQFAAEKSEDPKARARLDAFLIALHETAFAVSPSLVSHLPLNEMLFITARANRVPEIQGFIGQTMVGEIVYDLAYAEHGPELKILKTLLRQPIADALDAIDQLQTIGAHASGQGEWARPAVIKVVAIIEALQHEAASPLLRYAAQNALARLKQEHQEPSVGVITWHGNKNAARLDEPLSPKMLKEHETLSRRVLPDKNTDGAIAQIAKDAIALLDHSNLPRFLGKIDVDAIKEQKPAPISTLAIKRAREAIAAGPMRPEEIVDFITYINTRVLRLGESWAETPDVFVHQWQAIAPEYNWQHFFYFDSYLNDLEAHHPHIEDDEEAEDDLNAELWVSKEFNDRMDFETEIGNSQHIFLKQLDAYLSRKETELRAQVTPLHCVSYRETPQDPTLNPFNQDADRDLALLLQNLHRPSLRERIESDLHINLVEIPLRAQIHFLRFLAGQDQQGFERLRKVLTARPGQANKILNCFLANAEDPRYAEALLTIAEKIEPQSAEAIFDKYTEIVRAADAAEEYLSGKLPSLRTNSNAIHSIRISLLHRANTLLREYSEKSDQPTSVIERSLTQIHSDILLFAATCKIASENSNFSLETIRDTEIQTIETSQLTPTEKNEIRELFESVRSQDNYSQSHLIALKQGLDEVLTKGVGRFYVMKHENKIVAFVRFEDLPNGNVYAGSFTASPDVRGSTIGSSLIQIAFAKENANRALEAIVFSGNPRLMEYHTKTLGHRLLRDQTLMIGDALYYRMVRPPQNATTRQQAA